MRARRDSELTGIAHGARGVRWQATSFVIAFIACFLLLAGCAANSGQAGSASTAKQVDVKSEAVQEAAESSSATDGPSPSYTGGWGILSDGTIDEFMEKLEDMIRFLIPNYVKEGKNQLVIAIGCTGGQGLHNHI